MVHMPIALNGMELVQGLGHWFSVPLSVTIEVTRACNLRCLHCYAAADKPLENELSTDEVKRLIKEIADEGVKLLVFSGGEPLMRPDFYEILSYAAEETSLELSVATNATLVTKSVAKALRESAVFDVVTSLDGATPETHDRLRGVPGAFKRTIRGIKLLKGEGLRVTLVFTATALNYRELPKVLELADDLGVDRVGVNRYVCAGRGLENVRLLEMDPGLRTWLNWYLNYQKAQGRDLRVNTYCSAGRTFCAVKPNGAVVPCFFYPDLNAANIREVRFIDAWRNSEVFKPFREPWRLRGLCSKCPSLIVCRGGCRARAVSVTGDPYAADPLCVENMKRYGFLVGDEGE